MQTLDNIRYIIAAIFIGAATVILPCCGKQDDTSARTDAQSEALRTLDDSLAIHSPAAEKMIQTGLDSATDSLEYYDYYLRLMRTQISLALPDTAAIEWDRVIKFLESQPQSARVKGMLGVLYNSKGYLWYKMQCDPHETIGFYTKAYEVLQNSDQERSLPDVCANIGDSYMELSEMPEAAQWYRRALFLCDSLQLPEQSNLSLYMGLGRIYQNLEDFDAALRCYETVNANIDQLPLHMKIYFLNNFGNYHYYTKDYTAALATFDSLENLLTESGLEHDFDIYICRLNLADVHLNLGNTGNAVAYLDMVEPFFRKYGVEPAIYYANTIRIGLAMQADDTGQVRQILDSEQINGPIDFTLVNIRSRYMQEYYVKRNDFRKAYASLKSDIAYNDSLQHNIARMRSAEIMMRHAQDTIQLHHHIIMQQKDADIQSMHNRWYGSIVGIVILALLSLYLLTLARKRHLQNEIRLIHMKLAAARNRISPHFIFNVLNNRITATDKKDADELMALAKLIRENLNISGKEYVSLQEEIDFVRYYIDVCSHSIGPDFEFRIEAPDTKTMRSIYVPSMFIQILVENAIKHALKNKEGHKELLVRITVDSMTCHISVIDNGPGFDIRRSDASSTKTGLRVIRSSIALINRTQKRKIKFNITNIHTPEGEIAGCNATLSIPATGINTDNIDNSTE